MIPQKIQALFDFINFLDVNKQEYIEKYIPICNEIRKLDKKRNKLKPKENYKDKLSYECIQREIKEKFEPIIENIYKPVTSKLIELGIWSGDDAYTSIWNNNILEIEDFKRNFTQEDLEQVLHYKQKYLLFRTETNNDFLCLSLVFSKLDQLYRVLFDFFKETQENEFDSFETKTFKVRDFGEIAENIKDNVGKNVKYSIPSETIFRKKQATPTTEIPQAINYYNIFNMGDKIEVGNISKNKGQITIGKDNKTEVNSSDKIAKKTFLWQKLGTIIGIIIGIISLIIDYFR
jgi:hypothetical protein